MAATAVCVHVCSRMSVRVRVCVRAHVYAREHVCMRDVFAIYDKIFDPG